MKYKYHRGTRNSNEIVEFETTAEPLYRVTTCVVDVDHLLCGISVFPCGSGDDVKLSNEQKRDILRLVQEERRKITQVPGPKTMQMWEDSGLRDFGDYVKVGDEVAEDVVDYFVNSVPPRTLRRSLVQAGEPYSHEYSEEARTHKATYTTFKAENGKWIFAGHCFAGESENRTKGKGRLEAALFDVEYLIGAKEYIQEAGK